MRRGLHRLHRLDRGLTPLAGQHRHLAEEVAPLQPVEAAAHVHLGRPTDHDVHGVAGVAPLHDGLAGVERHPAPDPEDLLEVLAAEPREQRRPLQRREPNHHLVHAIPPATCQNLPVPRHVPQP
jgi:hypothetical protein